MTERPGDLAGERSDAVRNRALLLEAAAWLVAERGAEHLTMHEVAQAAGVGKGTLFRRFGDRNGLLLALLDDVEADFHEAYTSGPPPLGPGAPAKDRLRAFGCALIERAACETDLGPALARQVPCERRQTTYYGRAFRHHVQALLREAGIVGDHAMLAHALLAFVDLETLDYLRNEEQVTTARLRNTWADLVRRVTGADER
ncbi:helix-turn-helix transcriptional regulator [Streptomyces sp. MC1]|uniref:TetR/AcrR family transcriptional regulator n=1 Tax=unclassified Streptomyces TaxID=2593676 RepID=UPI0004C7D751|nr:MULTISPECIES: TetR/AcrR family transcriptional regulator [unclassified Streptomyces]MBG7699232.1 helix-turn-helix transcriptional regulator [Streptomyces sp. MC1]